MQEPYEKGVAIRSAPSFALGTARYTAKRKQGNKRGGLWSSEKMQSGRRRPCNARKATWSGTLARVPAQSGVVEDPRHALKLHAREPGDLGDACCPGWWQDGERRLRPHGSHVRSRGVTQRHSTDESLEQRRNIAGGERGGKAADQGERSSI